MHRQSKKRCGPLRDRSASPRARGCGNDLLHVFRARAETAARDHQTPLWKKQAAGFSQGGLKALAPGGPRRIAGKPGIVAFLRDRKAKMTQFEQMARRACA